MRRRQVLAGALALALVGGCAPADGKPSDEEVLAAGNAELDAVRLPADWDRWGKKAERGESGLHWSRYYTVNDEPADVLRTIDEAMTAAGWQRDDDCMGPKGERCFGYEKSGFRAGPSAVDTSCPDGAKGCSTVIIGMRRV